MRAHVMSDIHLEHMRKHDGDKFYEQLEELHKNNHAPLLILAGDICQVWRHEIFWQSHLARIAAFYERVIYVPGNHEYYGSSFYEVDQYLEQLENTPNLHNVIVLQDGDLTSFQGQKFYGGTMWFARDGWQHWQKKGMNDFYVIKGFEPEVYLRNQKFLDGYAKHANNDLVVISHHAPTEASIAHRFQGSDLNPFFCFDMTPYLNEGTAPKLWIHGHMHDACDYTHSEGKTKMQVWCNPHGYPHEGANTQFWNRIVIDIPDPKPPVGDSNGTT